MNSKQMDTTHLLVGCIDMYCVDDERMKVEWALNNIIQSALVGYIIFSSCAINPLSVIPPAACFNISSLSLICKLPLTVNFVEYFSPPNPYHKLNLPLLSNLI